MNCKVGVWIDHRRAIVVTISDQGEEVRQFNSDVEKSISSARDSEAQPPDHSRGIVVESTQERKFASRLNTFYDVVLASLANADALLIIGPGEAKGELRKRLNCKTFPAHVVDIETADKMTNPQIVALVRQHFEVA